MNKIFMLLFVFLTSCTLINKSRDLHEQIVGLYINDGYRNGNGYVEILNITKAGSFEQWRYSDAQILGEDHKCGVIVHYSNVIILKFDDGEVQKKYLVNFENNYVLFREDSYKIWQEKNQIYSLGVLINISKNELNIKMRNKITRFMAEIKDFSKGVHKQLLNSNGSIFEPKIPWLGKYEEYKSN